MDNDLQSIIQNLEKDEQLIIGNGEKFSNEIVSNESLQISVVGEINFLNLTFKNIDFVKQAIGHRKLDTISAYLNKLSDQERQKRIEQF